MKVKVRTVIALVVAGLTVTGCGGSSAKHSTHTAAGTATTTTSAASSAATATTPTVSSGPVHASLHGPTHKPEANKLWIYTVRVTDAGGKPLSGTVETEFTFAGTVVGRESPPVHRLKDGQLRDKFRFPVAAVGHPITVVTVIHTSAGSVALGWPVLVSQ